MIAKNVMRDLKKPCPHHPWKSDRNPFTIAWVMTETRKFCLRLRRGYRWFDHDGTDRGSCRAIPARSLNIWRKSHQNCGNYGCCKDRNKNISFPHAQSVPLMQLWWLSYGTSRDLTHIIPENLTEIRSTLTELWPSQGIHVSACAEATVDSIMMKLIGNHLELNPHDTWKFG